MKISKKQLEQLIESAVEKKLSSLNESSDFTAKRRIIYSAQNMSMEFEEEIKNILNLKNPDELEEGVQQKYFEVVEKMKDDIIKAVSVATRDLVRFPRNDDGEGSKSNGQ